MSFNCFIFLVLIAGAAAYTEIIPTRCLFQSKTNPHAPPTWSTVPANTATQVVGTSAGVLTVTPDSILLGREFLPITLNSTVPLSNLNGARLVTYNRVLTAIVTPTAIHRLTRCDLDPKTGGTCQLVAPVPAQFGVVHAAVAAADGSALWIAAQNGLFVHRLSAVEMPKRVLATPISAVVAAVNGLVVAGNDAKLWHLNASTTAVMRWEWVTDVQQGWGGVVDDRVTDMAFARDSATPDLYIGNPTCLNVWSGRRRTYARVGADEGLPFRNITAVLTTSYRGVTQVWLGTTMGVIIWQPGHGVDGRWRYCQGPRWLAGDSVRSMAVDGDSVVVVTEAGITWLEQQEWTLARKAVVYEKILTSRHDRHGMTAECKMSGFGNLSSCVGGDSDNNGLWTSLVVVAEYLRYAVTGDKDALSTGTRFFEGMVLLNEVTGKKGLMARSACAPDEKGKTCAGPGTWIHDRTRWRNSTNPSYKGWIWKSDTSSDETTGHVFALSVVAAMSPSANQRARATQLLLDFVSGVCRNGYLLIDVTGNSTTWGKWSPRYVNDFRPFSDERGLQSLQMLAYLSAAHNLTLTQPRGGGRTGGQSIFEKAYAELTNSTNQYLQNLLNLKITSPIDDNYSDDELTFLPFFTFLSTCPPPNLSRGSASTYLSRGSASCPFDRSALLAALRRTFEVVRGERSNLWGAIMLAVGEGLSASDREEVGRDVVWNLQTWPLELIDWPVNNSHRIDIVYEDSTNRFGSKRTDSLHSRPPLPANERRQDRWNTDPYDVTDGGSGTSETDPGAWLLPYWMARYYGVVKETD